MQLAGVEYGQQCFCGQKLNYPPTPSDGCHMSCSASSTETCGGNDAIEVYTYNCSGAPVPEPPQTPPCKFNQEGCSRLINPCLNTSLPFHAMPFCDPTKTPDEV